MKRIFKPLIENYLDDMEDFGLSKFDIDSDGYVTLYHGGKILPDKLNKDEIFFMTPHEVEAQDYADMRHGEVYTIKVDPSLVNWNTGSYEVEYEGGGIIRDGIIIPSKEKKVWVKSGIDSPSYKGVNIGDVMPKSNFVVQDIVVHSENSAQFLFDNGWYDAKTVMEYEDL